MIDDQIDNMSSLDSNSTNPKELFELKEIDGKTELNAEQVMIISRMRVLGSIYAKKYKIDHINNLIENFLKLQVSKDRKSRQEFVSAFQSKNDERVGGLMDKMSFNAGMK